MKVCSKVKTALKKDIEKTTVDKQTCIIKNEKNMMNQEVFNTNYKAKIQ